MFCQTGQDTSLLSIDLDEYVISAQYEPTHYKNAIQNIEIINKKTIENLGATTLDQALISSPNIRINIDPILGTSIKMRSLSSNNVAILIDGIPVIGRLGGNIDVSQISLSNVERIEIIEGSLSNLYGNNAAGGIINIITKKSQIKKRKCKISHQIESVKRQNLYVDLGYKWNKLTFGGYLNTLKYRQYTIDSLRLTKPVKIGDNTYEQSVYPFNPKNQFHYGAHLRYDTPTFLFLLKYDNTAEKVYDYGTIRRKIYQPYANDNLYKTQRHGMGLHTKKEWNNFFLDFKSAFNTYDRLIERNRVDLSTDTIYQQLQTIDTIQFNSYFNKAIACYTFNQHFKTLVGLNHSIEFGKGDRIKSKENENGEVQISEIAPFFEFRYTLKKLETSLSGRYTRHSKYKGKFTPAINIKYAINPKTNLRFGYAQGYRSPSLKELYLEFIDINHYIIGNTELKPETTHDIQSSIHYEINKHIQLEAKAFYTFIKNRIGIVEFESLKYSYDNINEYNAFGIEPSLKFNYGDFVLQSTCSANRWISTLHEEDHIKGTLIDISNVLTYSNSRYHVGFSLYHRYFGNQPTYREIDNEITVVKTESYHNLDLTMHKYLVDKKIKLLLGVSNILDNKTLRTMGSSGGNGHNNSTNRIIGLGRNWFFNITIDI